MIKYQLSAARLCDQHSVKWIALVEHQRKCQFFAFE